MTVKFLEFNFHRDGEWKHEKPFKEKNRKIYQISWKHIYKEELWIEYIQDFHLIQFSSAAPAVMIFVIADMAPPRR